MNGGLAERAHVIERLLLDQSSGEFTYGLAHRVEQRKPTIFVLNTIVIIITVEQWLSMWTLEPDCLGSE